IAAIPIATATATITHIPTHALTPSSTDTPTITNTHTVTFTPTKTSTSTRTQTPRSSIMSTVSIILATIDPLQGVTAVCNDGTYSFSQHQQGTCSHHGGVKQWINRPPN